MPTGLPDEARLEALLASLRRSVRSAVSGAPEVSVLFSGGLDSSLVAYLLPDGLSVRLIAVGTPGSHDLQAAERSAASLRRTVERTELTGTHVEEAIASTRGTLAGLTEPARSVAISLAVALRRTPAGRVLCGQGADELFYGYAHFRGLDGETARRQAREDLSRLRSQDWPLAQHLAAALGQDLRAPFLDEGVEALALGFDPPGPMEPTKAVLRAAARRAGLPEIIVDRPKKAIQYGSGIARLARRVGSPVRSTGE